MWPLAAQEEIASSPLLPWLRETNLSLSLSLSRTILRILALASRPVRVYLTDQPLSRNSETSFNY